VSRSVAFLGPQGSGKSTIAALVVEHRGYQRHGIADAIKHVAGMAYRDLGKTETLVLDRYTGQTVITGRELLQDIGAALRSVDNKFWLRVWRRDYFELQRHGYGVVVDDVRLDAEVAYLRAVDPAIYIVGLHADEATRSARMGAPLSGTSDVTERGWTTADIDLILDTSGMTPEEAYRRITDGMEETE
jgi:gluconate kinase